MSYSSGGLDRYAYGADSVVVADVNGDGKPDLLVSNYWDEAFGPSFSGSVGVLLGNGDGTFQAAVTYSSGGYGAAAARCGLFRPNRPDA